MVPMSSRWGRDREARSQSRIHAITSARRAEGAVIGNDQLRTKLHKSKRFLPNLGSPTTSRIAKNPTRIEHSSSRKRYLAKMPRRARKPSHSLTDASRGIRIQKAIADAGLSSRRDAESMVEQGLVRVNGEVIDSLPAWVDPAKDRITVDGRVLRPPERHIYVMLHKPPGFVCTNSDPEGRRLVTELVEHPSQARLYPVGRLDFDTSGLLLMTNDGEFANRLTHPRYEVHKEYEVMVKGDLGPEDVARLEEGIFAPSPVRSGARNLSGHGDDAKAVSRSPHLHILRRDGERTVLTMELREGSNRRIRQLMADLGHPVKRLRRTRLGPVRLRGLAVGAWRDLTHSELSQLRQEAFADAVTIQRRRSAPSKSAPKNAAKVIRKPSQRNQKRSAPTGSTNSTKESRARR